MNFWFRTLDYARCPAYGFSPETSARALLRRSRAISRGKCPPNARLSSGGVLPPARSRKIRASGCGHVLQVMIPQLRGSSRHRCLQQHSGCDGSGPEATWACASGKTLLVSYSSAKRSNQEGCAFSTLLSEIKYDGHRPSWQIARWSRSRQHWGIEQFEPGVRPRPWGTQSIFRRRRGADALRASR